MAMTLWSLEHEVQANVSLAKEMFEKNSVRDSALLKRTESSLVNVEEILLKNSKERITVCEN